MVLVVLVVLVVSPRSLISVSITLNETLNSGFVHSAKKEEMASSPSCVSLMTVSDIDWIVGKPVCKSENGDGWACEVEEEEGEGEVRSRRQRRKDTPHVKVSEVSEEAVMRLKGCNCASGPVESLNVPSVSSLIDRLEKSKSSMYS